MDQVLTHTHIWPEGYTLFLPIIATGGHQHPGLVPSSTLGRRGHQPGAVARAEPWETWFHCRQKMVGAAGFTAPRCPS